MTTFSFIHIVASVAALLAGLAVLPGLVAGRRPGSLSTSIFLAATIIASAAAFGVEEDSVVPTHVNAAMSLAVLAVATFAVYGRHLAGAWGGIYVVTAVTAVYLNVFVLIGQAFLRVPVLQALAPTQTEQPFTLTQALVLATFAVLMKTAVRAARARAMASRPT